MPVSPEQQRFSPSQPHRRHLPNGWPGCTASLPVEPKKSFICDKILFFREPNEPKEPNPANRPQVLRRECRNQIPERTHFPSQPKQNEPSYTSEPEPISATGEPVCRARAAWPPGGRFHTMA